MNEDLETTWIQVELDDEGCICIDDGEYVEMILMPDQWDLIVAVVEAKRAVRRGQMS